MTRFAANLTMLFTELPMLDRFSAAKRAGFSGVEILFPYDIPAQSLAKAAEDQGLDIVLINAPPPNWSGGARGFAALPGGEARFQQDFERALEVAQTLRARHIHIMSGKAQGAIAHDTLIRNLRWAVARAPHTALTIEPLNPIDTPGYFLNCYDLAKEIIQEVGADTLGLQFDTYHAHLITGDVVATWHRYADLVRHIQISGAPGRHEPQGSEIDFQTLFTAIDQSGYAGWISAEYTPRLTTEAGLGWLRIVDTTKAD